MLHFSNIYARLQISETWVDPVCNCNMNALVFFSMFVQICSCLCHLWGCWSLLCGSSLQRCGRWFRGERFLIMKCSVSLWRWWRPQFQTCSVQSNGANCFFDWEPKWARDRKVWTMSCLMDTFKPVPCQRDTHPCSFLFFVFQIILELCRNEETASILCVQPHLERIHTGVSEGRVYILLITMSPPKKK